jgi:hypothetical protein
MTERRVKPANSPSAEHMQLIVSDWALSLSVVDSDGALIVPNCDGARRNLAMGEDCLRTPSGALGSSKRRGSPTKMSVPRTFGNDWKLSRSRP